MAFGLMAFSFANLEKFMEALYFTAVAAALYFLSDWLLRRIERARGQFFEQRTLIFFAILLGSALVAFAAIRQISGS